MDTGTRPRTPSRIALPFYEDGPRSFGGRGTLKHSAAPSTSGAAGGAEQPAMPSARSFSSSYRSRSPHLYSYRGPTSRPESATPSLGRPRTSESSRSAGSGSLYRPSTGSRAMQNFRKLTDVKRPQTANAAFRDDRPLHPSLVFHPYEDPLRSARAAAGGTSGSMGRRDRSAGTTTGRGKSFTQHNNVTPVGSLIKAKATNTLKLYMDGVVNIVKDYNGMREEAERKVLLLKDLESTSKVLKKQAEYTAIVAAPDNEEKVKAKRIARELETVQYKYGEVILHRKVLEHLKNRIYKIVVKSKQDAQYLTSILDGATTCKVDVQQTCKTATNQKDMAKSAVSEKEVERVQKHVYHKREIKALQKVVKNQQQWTDWENAWKKREKSRPKHKIVQTGDMRLSSQMNISASLGLKEKLIAQRIDNLLTRTGIQTLYELIECFKDAPRKQKGFEQDRKAAEARLEQIKWEQKGCIEELRDYQKGGNKGSTRLLSEYDDKIQQVQQRCDKVSTQPNDETDRRKRRRSRTPQAPSTMQRPVLTPKCAHPSPAFARVCGVCGCERRLQKIYACFTSSRRTREAGCRTFPTGYTFFPRRTPRRGPCLLRTTFWRLSSRSSLSWRF